MQKFAKKRGKNQISKRISTDSWFCSSQRIRCTDLHSEMKESVEGALALSVQSRAQVEAVDKIWTIILFDRIGAIGHS